MFHDLILTQNTLAVCLRQSFPSMVFSDFTISFQGQQFHCHLHVLRSRSPVFDKMLSPTWKEFYKRYATLDDDFPEAIEFFLYLVYGQELKRSLDKEYFYEVFGLIQKCMMRICHGTKSNCAKQKLMKNSDTKQSATIL